MLLPELLKPLPLQTALIPKDSVLPATLPVVKPSKSSNLAASYGQCVAKVWVATSFESVSHIEVISVFPPTEKVRIFCDSAYFVYGHLQIYTIY